VSVAMIMPGMRGARWQTVFLGQRHRYREVQRRTEKRRERRFITLSVYVCVYVCAVCVQYVQCV
jgi:hypothetical protein